MKKDFLVVVHIYYTDQIDLIINCLKNIPFNYDLYITSDKKNKTLIYKKISKYKPDFNFVAVENIGYDVWPFIKVINDIDLDKYKYLIKLHTKRDMIGKNLINGEFVYIGNKYFIHNGSVWRDNLFEFIKTQENLQKCINALENNKNIGMCCRFNLIHDMKKHMGVIDDAKKTYPKYVFNLDNYSFVAGTMFISKIKPIKLIKNMNITKDLFEKSSDEHKPQFAHLIERTLGEAVYKSGMKIVDPFTPKEYIKHIDRYYFKLNCIRRFVNYIVFLIPETKIRRKIREKLMDKLYVPYLRYAVDSDMEYSIKK